MNKKMIDRDKFLQVAEKALAMAYPTKNLGIRQDGKSRLASLDERFFTIQMCIATLLQAEGFNATKVLKEIDESLGEDELARMVIEKFEENDDWLSDVNADSDGKDKGF